MQTGNLEGKDRAVHGEQAGWKGLRAEMEDHSSDKGGMVDDAPIRVLV